jgi:hypothetical protein
MLGRAECAKPASTPAGFSKAQSQPTCPRYKPTKFEMVINL